MSDSTKNIIEWIYCIVIAIVLALLIKFFLGTPTVVKQYSMYPTYKPNDRLILNRLERSKMPKRGDVVTFEAPSKNIYGPGEYDLNNPVAKYQNQPNSIRRVNQTASTANRNTGCFYISLFLYLYKCLRSYR